MIFAILAAVVYWVTRVVKHAQYIMKMTEIQQFYVQELKIQDDQLPNLTWHAIVKRICEAQKKLRLSIHQDNITSIYIYHRILRYKNYMTGMINKVRSVIFVSEFMQIYISSESSTQSSKSRSSDLLLISPTI